jgi:sterol desaturase/sphingolipid hydroxylase (fatty acid hydroxylase superfamily)
MINSSSSFRTRSASGEALRPWFRALYLPAMLLGVNGAGILLAAPGGNRLWLLVPLGLAAIALTTVAEQLIPYTMEWNLSRLDTGRDIAHAVVNQAIEIAGVLALPVIVAALGLRGSWPAGLPFVVQVVMAVVVADAGITLIHYASHKVFALWRFHAVHHSVRRLYGLNGLLEHPINAVLEMLGAVPLIVLGVPIRVAAVLALCAAVQLILQHSNADYSIGPLRYVLALNESHRLHHLRSMTEGNVNFGLFTLFWDHILGTFAHDPNRRFSSADIGIDQWPHYPNGYLAQLAQPFRGHSSLTDRGDVRKGSHSRRPEPDRPEQRPMSAWVTTGWIPAHLGNPLGTKNDKAAVRDRAAVARSKCRSRKQIPLSDWHSSNPRSRHVDSDMSS